MSQRLEAGGARVDDPEDFLVLRGWQTLEHRSAGEGQHVKLVRSADHGKNECRLTRREFQVTYLAALGFASKQTAVELHVAWATARATLSSALNKLRLRAHTHLPAFWHALVLGGRTCVRLGRLEVVEFSSRFDRDGASRSLTLAEEDVLKGVIAGETNEGIARRRHTSERTVANQLAALFQKFGVSTRNELAAKSLRLLPSSEHERWLRGTRN